MGAIQQLLAAIGASAGSPTGDSWGDAAYLDGPAGLWLLNETAGAVAADVSGNARDGAYVGSPTLSSTGATLNGSTQWIDLSDAAFDAIGAAGQDFTLEVVIATGTTQSNKAIFDKTEVSGPADWNLMQQAGDGTQVTFQLYDGINNPSIAGANNITSGADFYLVAVRNAAANTVKLYINAVEVASASDSGTHDYANTIGLALGSRQAGTDRFWTGKVRRAAVYLSALTPTQIANHYAAR